MSSSTAIGVRRRGRMGFHIYEEMVLLYVNGGGEINAHPLSGAGCVGQTVDDANQPGRPWCVVDGTEMTVVVRRPATFFGALVYYLGCRRETKCALGFLPAG